MKREDLYARSFRGEDGFDEFVSALGGDPAAVTKASGLSLEPPSGAVKFESFADMCALFEQGALQTGDPYFGLKWALHQPDDFRFSGPNVLLISMANNVRQWLDMAIDYQKVTSNGCAFSYVEDVVEGTITGVISVHPLAPPCRQFLEQLVAGIALIGRQFLPDFQLKLITLQHSPPEDMDLFDEIFQCPIIFNAERNTVVADLEILEHEKRDMLSKVTLSLIKQYLNWKLLKHPKAKQSISMMVAEAIPATLGVNGSDMKHVSQALNIHPKKLQRLLKQEGTTYSEILETVRKNIAARLLTESDIEISRIAKMLDYVSDGPLATAMRRWYGMNSSEFRKARRTRYLAE